MNLSYAVDSVRSNHTQVGHVDPFGVALLDQRHPSQTVCVTGEPCRYHLMDAEQGLQNVSLYKEECSPAESSLVESSRVQSGRVQQSYIQVFLVDVVDDYQMSWEQLLEHEHWPTFQRLRKNRVVGVGTGPTGDVPRLNTNTR